MLNNPFKKRSQPESTRDYFIVVCVLAIGTGDEKRTYFHASDKADVKREYQNLVMCAQANPGRFARITINRVSYDYGKLRKDQWTKQIRKVKEFVDEIGDARILDAIEEAHRVEFDTENSDTGEDVAKWWRARKKAEDKLPAYTWQRRRA